MVEEGIGEGKKYGQLLSLSRLGDLAKAPVGDYERWLVEEHIIKL